MFLSSTHVEVLIWVYFPGLRPANVKQLKIIHGLEDTLSWKVLIVVLHINIFKSKR